MDFRNQVGDIKKTDLPGPDALLTPGLSRLVVVWGAKSDFSNIIGKKPGEVKMIKEDEKVVAYQVCLRGYLNLYTC